jgi:2,3-bisphosphoglycerate-independent phosphoglycerate mutase
VVLVILDGVGQREERSDNAVRLAQTPVLASLERQHPRGILAASGADVGLLPGQVGDSRSGHLSLGTGQLLPPAATRIEKAIHEGTLAANGVIRDIVARAKNSGGRLHLIGLLSDAGVHSSVGHLYALIDVAKNARVRAVVHALLDGRDVPQRTAARYVTELEGKLSGGVGRIGTVAGRHWGMDRDYRWERVQRCYRAMLAENTHRADSALRGIEQSYEGGSTDELLEPFVVSDYPGVSPVDTAIHFNFRGDRAHELTHALALPDFDAFVRKGGRAPFAGRYACMTTCDGSQNLPVAFPHQTYPNGLAEIISRAGLRQFRCAEALKFAHVTSFFNGHHEEPFEGEDRKVIWSPPGSQTYDKKPEMAAASLADASDAAIRSGRYDFVVVNLANPDIVGHTGVLASAMRAVEATDAAVGKIVQSVRSVGGALMVTGSHGNCELMRDPESGQPHRGHTTNPVPFFYMNDADSGVRIREGGRLCDVGPTVLELMGLPQPEEMTGRSLLMR